jgi:predicted nucleotidyltransferase
LCSSKRDGQLIEYIVADATERQNVIMDVVEKLRRKGITIDLRTLAAVAEEYGISEVSVFGSAIRNDDSIPNDVDLLVVFEQNQDVSLFDVMELEASLTGLFGQPVDVVEPASLTNPIRRQSILASAERLYAA